MAFTLNRRLAQLVDSNGQLNAGKIPDNEITQAKLHSSFTVTASHLGTSLTPTFGNTTVGSRLTFSSNSHYLETGTNAVAIKSSGGNVYLNATNAGTVINNGLTVNSNITTTGYLAGPSTFTIDPAAVGDNTGTVVIAGNLQVDGTTTTINSTTLTVDDKIITIADGAADAAAANESGINVDGASAQILYKSTNDRWELNKEVFSAFGFMIGTTSTDVGLIRNSSGVFDFQAQSGRQISFSNVNNGEHVRIDADGKVGIGITSPGRQLHVQMPNLAAGTGNGIRITDDSALMEIGLRKDGSGNRRLAIFEDGGTYPLVLQEDGGNVGIGTTSGSGLLNLAKGTRTLDVKLETSPATGDVGVQFRAGASDYLGLAAGGGSAVGIVVDDSNKVGIGTTSPDAELQIMNNDGSSYRFGYGGSSDVYLDADNVYIRTDSGGANTATFTTSGLGIGTTSPSAKLHLQPSNSDTLATSIFTRQNNAAGTDGNTFSLRNDAANNFVEMNSGGTNNGGYKFYTGTFSSSPAMTIVGAGSNGNNVGIGDTNPGHKLVVTANSTGLAANIGNTNSNGFGANIYGGNGTNYAFRVEDYNGNERFRVTGAGNVGIGIQNPAYALHVNSKLAVGDSPASGLSGNTVHVRENSNSGIHFPLVIGGGTHAAGAAFGIGLDPEGYGNRNKIAILAEGTGQGYSRGRLHIALDSANDSGQVTLADSKMCILENGNVGIGAQLDNAGHKLHIWGGNADTVLAVTTNDNYLSELRLMEDKAGTQHGGYIRYEGNGDYTQIGTYNSGSDTTAISIDDSGNVGVGVTNPGGHFEVHDGRMGIISSSSSWGQLRVANPNAAEVGITVANGCTGSEFLTDGDPSSSNKFIMGISPYGSGSDTWGIGHGNLGDSIMHIDGSGNFGFGPHTDNPLTYFEISKTRPNVNAPSDYELKLTLNTYGYVGSNYKLGMLQWVGGDTASAQDNFYAGIGATAMDGANNSEEGSIDFHVRNGVSSTDTLAMRIIGKAGTSIAGGGQHAYGVMFPYQGIAIDRVWGGYPGVSVFNSAGGGSGTMQSEFRFHGTNSASTAYPGTSGGDFSASVRADGGFITGSDRRRKKNITTISNALDTVKQLTGKRFQTVNRDGDVQEHVSKNGYQLGFIAQDIEDIIPETIKYHPDEDDGTEGWNTAYSMDYAAVVALLVNAIKEQDTTIQDLKSRIETLEG